MTELSPFRLDGMSVLISGAAGGIGRALIDAFGAAGAVVSGADRTREGLDGLPLAYRLVADLADMAATDAAVRRYLEDAGVPDIVVSNAGFTRAETIESLDIHAWESELAINLNGAYALTAPIVAAMATRGSGSLVFIASVNGLLHLGNPAYSAAKAGLIAYARAIAVERGSSGIRANVVCPGSVRTPAWDHRLADDPGLMSRVVPHYPLGRLVTPAEVANTAVFLSSPAAAGITGATIVVDAGLTAGNLRFVDDVLRG
jgi:NAD(P)-dependent dehydrogenase (short-subunit alcohol dehydrogenase family)